MSDTNEKTNEKRGGLGAFSLKAAKAAGGAALKIGRTAKLNGEIASEKDKIRSLQLEVGKLYFENFGEDPHPLLRDVCRQISDSLETIREKRTAMEELEKSDGE